MSKLGKAASRTLIDPLISGTEDIGNLKPTVTHNGVEGLFAMLPAKLTDSRVKARIRRCLDE